MPAIPAIPARKAALLLIVLSFVLYGNSIRNGYCLDDNFVVTDNANVQRGFAGIETIMNSPYAQYGRSTLDYRPIAQVTFAMEHQFFGNNPHISHFINVLLYAASLVLIYILLIRVFELDQTHPWLPLFITLLYAVHPLHTEVVDSLKNRDELFGMLFGMLFLLYGYAYYTSREHRKRKAILSLVFLALCLMSKITGVVFIGFFVFICWFKGIFRVKRNYLFLAVSFLIAIKGMHRALSGLHRTINSFENPLQQNTDILVSIGTSLKILLYHLKMLVFPYPLCFYYGYNVFPLNGMNDVRAMISLVLHAGLLLYGFRLFFKKDRLGLFILLYFCAVFLYTNFPIPYTGMFSERAMLLSSLWFIAILLLLVFRIMARWMKKDTAVPKLALLVFVAVFITYAMLTIRRNFQWENNLTLMGNDITHLDRSLFANYIYANNLKSASDSIGNNEEGRELALKAVHYYKRTIGIVPGYPEFYYKLGNVYQYNLKEQDKAEAAYKKAIGIDSFYASAQYELGKLYHLKGDERLAYRYLGNAHAINPTDSVALYLFAQSASAVGDMPVAYRLSREFADRYPELPVANVNMGICYSKLMKDDSAVVYFEKAIQQGYREPQLIGQMVVYFDKRNNKEKSEFYRSLLSPK